MRRHSMIWMAAAGLCALCAVHAPLAAAQTPDVAEGAWIDLFDGETLFGWTRIGDAAWQIGDGALAARSGAGGWLASSAVYGDFELEARVRVKSGGTSGIAVRAGLEGYPADNGGAVLFVRGDDSDDWRSVRITARGAELTATVDGEAAELTSEGDLRPKGRIGFLYPHANAEVEVAEARLRPLGMRSLFNGENLDGWNILPDHRSKFAVVDGALNITDGNGQIETAELFRDFILQLEVFSNGDRLNSGVFFRGPVGVFWKGYEAQVRNEWEGDDRTRPVDFGTGGLYAIQPARKVVSSDGAWFTMTISCVDNHMAVWVDGYLVSDFTDTRPVNAAGDAKAGYVPAAGTIHLQGHDPTTDLSFRNIHIQTYP